MSCNFDINHIFLFACAWNIICEALDYIYGVIWKVTTQIIILIWHELQEHALTHMYWRVKRRLII